ncbi:MAG: hypothetical protein EBR82_75740 [Caulobacteraceae bacterium]|nr:hypothetical protein [Caulobacteraceae bacterium]
MTEFYTAEAMAQIWKDELDAENFYNDLIDAYDPYNDDYDGDDLDESYEGNEDAGMEGYLFGWDS